MSGFLVFIHGKLVKENIPTSVVTDKLTPFALLLFTRPPPPQMTLKFFYLKYTFHRPLQPQVLTKQNLETPLTVLG